MNTVIAHKVRVENYYGPLDLLLHLVREAEIDITRVSLANVAAQYITFIEAMKRLDINIAGEFLTVASQLLLIKSRAILPADEMEENEEEEDASLELIRRLLEYKIYKDRAQALGRMLDERSCRAGRPRFKSQDKNEEEEPIRDMEIWDLVVLWSRLAKAVQLDTSMDILYQTVPIETFIDQILSALQTQERVSFQKIVGDPGDKSRMIGTFLAVLELMKEQRLDAEQSENGGDILLRKPQSTGHGAQAPTS